MDFDYYAQYFAFEHEDWWFVARRKIVFALLEDFLGKRRGEALILDAGCGTGINLERLSGFGKTIGVDCEPVALDFCRKRACGTLVNALAEAVPFPDRTFDVVTCLDVIEHIEEDAEAVCEMARVLKPGGILVLTVPAFQLLWSDHDIINHHKRRYVRKRIQELLAGRLEILQLSYYNTHLMPIAVLVRLLKRLQISLFPSGLRKIRAENTYLPRSLNALFAAIFGSELFWLRRTALPVGLSIVCVARRDPAEGNL